MSQGRDVAAEKVVLVCLAGKKPSALLDHLGVLSLTRLGAIGCMRVVSSPSWD